MLLLHSCFLSWSQTCPSGLRATKAIVFQSPISFYSIKKIILQVSSSRLLRNLVHQDTWIFQKLPLLQYFLNSLSRCKPLQSKTFLQSDWKNGWTNKGQYDGREIKKTDILDYILEQKIHLCSLTCCHLPLDYFSTLSAYLLYALSKKYVKIFHRGSCLMNFTHFLQQETLIILRILQFYSLIKTYNYISKPNQLINCSSALPFLFLFGNEKG